jgi:hypothetical protein
MSDWKPLEVVAMVGVASAGVAALGAVLAWFHLRNRQMELAGCTSDDQAARILTESLAKVQLLPPANVEEIMTTFARMDSAGKRSLASAVAGLVQGTDALLRPTLNERIMGVVRGLAAASLSQAGGKGGPEERVTDRRTGSH